MTPAKLAALLALIDDSTISGKIAKTVFDDMVEHRQGRRTDHQEKGLRQVTDTSEIETIIDGVISGNPKSVEDFKGGKEKALKFLVGQVMKESKGKANPQMVNEILLKKLRSHGI